MGGTKLTDAGVQVVQDYGSISVTGITETIGRLKDIRQAFHSLKSHLMSEQPSLLILVDFPGFNLEMAKFANRLGIPVVYFIPPQIWAWRKNRVHQIKRFVDKVISILPFEEPIYRHFGIDLSYVGHPFATTVRPRLSKDQFLSQLGLTGENRLLTIMPGSRTNEVLRHLPVMVSIIRCLQERLGGLSVLLPLAENLNPRTIAPILKRAPRITLIKGNSHDAMAHSDFAVIASGSATLEAAILGTPSIVIYRVSPVSFFLAKLLVNVKYISLPNLIADKEVFPEFIQTLRPDDIAERAIHMVNNEKERIKNETAAIRAKLGQSDSYELAADAIVTFLSGRYGTIS
jgi:lipid-A-disaccharide synthase